MSDHIILRGYQDRAIENIIDCLNENDKCLVKMFCGTGKTTVMLHHTISQNYDFSVFVFPSIALITQFNKDYLQDKTWNITTNTMSVCSKDEMKTFKSKPSTIAKSLFTTDTTKISQFLSNNNKKIVCVTYE